MRNETSNSDFKFQSELRPNLNLELLFTEHIEELRQRSFHVLIFLLVLSCTAFLNIKPIVHLLEIPVQNVKFFQLSPGDYFISTVKIALYTGILSTSPFLLSQLTFFVIPGLNAGEKKTNITTISGINRFVFY
jgi:sec-independent protein translocase protein TatC